MQERDRSSRTQGCEHPPNRDSGTVRRGEKRRPWRGRTAALSPPLVSCQLRAACSKPLEASGIDDCTSGAETFPRRNTAQTKGYPSLSTTAHFYSDSHSPFRPWGKQYPPAVRNRKMFTAGDPFQYKSDYFQRSYCRFRRLVHSLQVGFEVSHLPPNCRENKSFILKKSCSLTASALPSLNSLPSQSPSTRLHCQTVHVCLARPCCSANTPLPWPC